MRRRNVLTFRRFAGLSLLVAATGLLACGSRTGLFDGELIVGEVEIEASINIEAGIFIDGHFVQDAPFSLDVQPPVDVYRNDCPDADALLVYTITDSFQLQSFNPASGTFTNIGQIDCPAGPGFAPFSMAVDRKGLGYVLFTDGVIYQISTATGACIPTSFEPDQHGFFQFGMGFATNSIGPTESLYVAGDARNGGTPGLAHVDTSTFKLNFIGNDPIFTEAELTGTGDGRLYAFYRHELDDGESNIGQIDTQTGFITGERHFSNVDQGNGWAFAFWGGDFYMFHAPVDHTIVTRWRPSDDSVVDVAETNGTTIVGAGVSTCAPQ